MCPQSDRIGFVAVLSTVRSKFNYSPCNVTPEKIALSVGPIIHRFSGTFDLNVFGEGKRRNALPLLNGE
jgi:hypothetical protein